MRFVLEAIEEGELRLSRVPFVRRLEGPGNLDDATIFASGLTFFAMAFQDILRLCEAKMVSPELRKIVSQHRLEEKDHDAWFLADLTALGVDCDIPWAFSEEHRITRDAAYELIADVCRTKSDYVRLALFFVLEATGAVFFSRVHEYMRSSGAPLRLQYFSARHHEIECGHQLLETGLREELAAAVLRPEERAEALDVVARGFEVFDSMFAEFEARIESARRRGASKLRSLPRLRAVGESETGSR